MSGCVYRCADAELKELMRDVYHLASFTNPLHVDIFPGVCKMEAEVVRMACRLFGGDERSCGTVNICAYTPPAFLMRIHAGVYVGRRGDARGTRADKTPRSTALVIAPPLSPGDSAPSPPPPRFFGGFNRTMRFLV